MEGTYTSPERIERAGRLVAFAGEVMTMDEAAARGLVKPGKQAEGKEPRKRAAKADEKPAGEAEGA